MYKLIDCFEAEVTLPATTHDAAIIYVEGAFVTTEVTREKLRQIYAVAESDVIGVTGHHALSDGRRYWCRIEADLKAWRSAPMPLKEADIGACIDALIGLEKVLRGAYRKFVLLGYSQGAIMALLAQMAAPEKYQSVVALLPATVKSRPFVSQKNCSNSLIAAELDHYCDNNMLLDLESTLNLKALVLPGHTHSWSKELVDVALKAAKEHMHR